MKAKTYLSFVALVLVVLVSNCKDEGPVIQEVVCKNDKSTELVSNMVDSLSCIDYVYNTNNKTLNIKHINTSFNCCVDGLYFQTTISVDTITIEEFEQNGQCNCMCLYDMDIEINNLQEQKYLIKIIEPNIGQQDIIVFEIDLAQETEGSYCVARMSYPWY